MLIVFLAVSSSCQRKAGEEKASVDSPQEFFERGRTKLHQENDYKGAIEEFDKAIEADRKYTDAYYWRAVAKCYLNDNEGCCNDYRKALKLGHPDAAEMIESYCNQ